LREKICVLVVIQNVVPNQEKNEYQK